MWTITFSADWTVREEGKERTGAKSSKRSTGEERPTETYPD